MNTTQETEKIIYVCEILKLQAQLRETQYFCFIQTGIRILNLYLVILGDKYLKTTFITRCETQV